jgi:uncharacterized repeat protein (TIGR01451 family)
MQSKVPAIFRCTRAKRFLAIVGGSLLLSAATLAALIGGGVDDPTGPFQLDGNAVTDTGSPFAASSEDWDKALGVVAGGHSIANTGVVVDITNSTSDNEFTGGSSKDIYDISQWLWNTSKPQGKDDIAHAFAAAYVLPNGHTAIYFGLDRYDGSGDATAGFWFLQDGTVAVNNNKSGGANGGFNGTHKKGDFLIVSDFSTGGAVSTIQVFQWQGSDGPTGHLVNVTPLISSNATCDITKGNATLCAITNATTQTSPWTFADKSGSSSFLHGEFLEGGIDLNAIFTSDVPCVTTFMAETRASNSPTSTLSDFSPPRSFPLCGIGVTKSCPQGAVNSAGTGFTYGYNGTVTNTGIGTVTNVVITDHLPANATNLSSDNGSFTVASLAPHQCVRWPGGDDCSSANPVLYAHFDSATNGPVNSAMAVADTPSGATVTAASDSDPNTPGNQPAQCPSVQVSPTLSIDKLCGPTCLTSGSGGDLVRVNFTGKVCNTSNVQLSNVQVTDVLDNGGLLVSGSSSIVSTTTGFALGGSLAPGACANLSGSYLPASGLDANGGFADHLHATATSTLGGSTPPQDSASRDCPVCPLGNCGN